MKKKKESKIKYQPIIRYESESVDITRFCCEALLAQNFYHNDNLENIKNLENILFNYSVIKILTWNKILESDDEILKDATTLLNVNNIIGNKIPTEAQKSSYFVQYIHCIIYILSVLNKHEQIEWIEDDNIKDINIISEDDIIKKVITPKNMSYMELPSNLINSIQKIYTKEPILIK